MTTATVLFCAMLAGLHLRRRPGAACQPSPGQARPHLYNRIKLEKAKAATPVDPARVTLIQTQRNNDLALIRYVEFLGFRVTPGDEATPESAAVGMDLILISESVDALDMAGKFRTTPVLSLPRKRSHPGPRHDRHEKRH